MTCHTLILLLRDASPPIADAPSSHFHAGRGGVRATNSKHRVPMRVGPMPTGRNMPSANITHSQSESIAVSSYPSMPSTTEDQPESKFMRESCEIRRRTRKVGKPTQTPPPKRDAQECEKLQKVPRRRGAARKDKLLESPNFLCGFVMFHLAAGQPCFMGWQNRKTALRLRPADPAPRGGLGVILKKGRRGREERECVRRDPPRWASVPPARACVRLDGNRIAARLRCVPRRLSRARHHADRAVPSGWPHRHHCAHRLPCPAEIPRPVGDRGQPR